MKYKFLYLVSFLVILSWCKDQKKEEIKTGVQFPPDAQYVVIFGQSSHLDISWFYTSEEYYEKLVRKIFIKTVEFLKQDAIHTSFFAEAFWIDKFLNENLPEKDDFLKFIKEGRIKIEGGGVGTDDQLVVPTEGIIRNYITGRKRMNQIGIQTTQNAWVPDSFGFPPSTPDLYKIMGFDSIGIARVNGFSAPTSVYYLKPLIDGSFEIPKNMVNKDSGGWELIEKGQLFIWKGLYGTEIIVYWMPFLYGIGSSLFCKSGLAPNVYLNPDIECLGEEDKANEEEFSQKLQTYLSKIKPNSKFVFVPLGWDFEKPQFNLGKYIRYWNEKYYPQKKIYLTSASFSDYIELVKKEQLPVFSGNLAPYWTGYFGSHANIKKFIFEKTYRLLSIETISSISKIAGIDIDLKQLEQKLSEIWWYMGMMTNHDTGAGTLYKKTYQNETVKLMEIISKKIEDLEKEVFGKIAQNTQQGKYIIFNPLSFKRKEIPAFGFKIADKPPEYKISPCSTTEAAGLKISTVLWQDDGGSWRIGSETPPGKFQETELKVPTQAKCELIDDKTNISIKAESIPLGHSLTVRISFPSKITRIKVEQHLDLIEFENRYLVYTPTFIPYLTFFKVYTEDGKSYTFSTKGAKGVAKTSENSVDAFIGRNVRFEKHDILGPIGDMSEDGPFEIEIQITQDTDELSSFFSSYSFHFPLIAIEGKSEKTNFQPELSVMNISDNLGILFSSIGVNHIRTVLPSKTIKFQSNIFKSSNPISPLTLKTSELSNTFELIK
ncbi:MAG: hypothetical protein NZ927_06500 [Candidatus Calescibacterium sp.]|nr:hypothetical protein [Candidatus Calescibacterium sp.]MCX7734072.1 hypothetical protein [bacterium]MDW8087070.1 hypothetical protein [Candidatus Calescibacterium sp.]